MSSPLSPAERLPTDWKSDAMRKRIARRYAAERRFRLLGLGAVLLSAAFLAFLLVTMMGNGLRGFTRTEIALKVDFPASPLLLRQLFRRPTTGGSACVRRSLATAFEHRLGRGSGCLPATGRSRAQ